MKKTPLLCLKNKIQSFNLYDHLCIYVLKAFSTRRSQRLEFKTACGCPLVVIVDINHCGSFPIHCFLF